MIPHSQRQRRHYRIKTQEQKTSKERKTTQAANKNSIVFQQQVKSLQNYFQFLQNIFGKKMEVKEIVKKVPHEEAICEQFQRQGQKKRSKSQYIHDAQAFQYIKLKATTDAVQKTEKLEGYRNSFKHSLIQIPSSRLKAKYYDSQRKRHSYLMQRMNYVPRKFNTSPIENQQFLNSDQNSEFLPVGRCISKEDRKRFSEMKARPKLSNELMKGITNKRQRHQRNFLKHQSEMKHTQYDRQKIDEATMEGPWRIVDATQYNPRSYYSTYR